MKKSPLADLAGGTHIEDTQQREVDMRLLVLAGVLAMAGCAEKPVEEMGYAEISALSKEIEQRCTDLGLTPGSPQHQQCKQVEAQKEISTRRANKNRRIAAATAMQQTSQGYYAAAQSSQTINCTTSPAIGWGSSRTTCY